MGTVSNIVGVEIFGRSDRFSRTWVIMKSNVGDETEREMQMIEASERKKLIWCFIHK